MLLRPDVVQAQSDNTCRRRADFFQDTVHPQALQDEAHLT